MTEAEIELHDRQVAAVAHSVANLLPKLAEQGFTPEVIFEGAVKGGATALLAGTDAEAGTVAELLDQMADAFRDLAAPQVRVVQ